MKRATDNSDIKVGLHLVFGASPNPDRYSYMTTALLAEHDYDVFAFGIRSGMINQVEIKRTLPEGNQIDTVTLYLNPERQKNHIQSIVDLKPKRVIFNPGTESESSKDLLKQSEIEYIEACTLVMLRTDQY